MEQNNKTNSAKMSTLSTSRVECLDVTLRIKTLEKSTKVEVNIVDPSSREVFHSEDFKMLPNVPLESYIQYTFGCYNAICKDKTENS